MGVCRRKTGVPIRAPLHGGTHAVSVSQINVVPHPDFVAIIDYRRTGQREQQSVHHLDTAPVVSHQGRQASANTQIETHSGVLGVDPVHIIPFFICNHLQGQLVVVTQKNGPLAGFGNGRRLFQDVGDRVSVFHVQRHEKPGHERKVKTHVTFISLSEILDCIFRPLVGLSKEHATRILFVHSSPEFFQKGVGFRQVLTVGAFLLVKVGNRVQPQSVHSHLEPEIEGIEYGLVDLGILKVQIRLVGVKTVPVIGLGNRVPCPVAGFKILENDAGFGVFCRCVAPDIEVSPRTAGFGPAGALKPGMLIGGVIDHQFRDHFQLPLMRFPKKSLKIAQGAVTRMNGLKVGNVVAVVLQGGRVKRQ